jgi:hypothetical protein
MIDTIIAVAPERAPRANWTGVMERTAGLATLDFAIRWESGRDRF